MEKNFIALNFWLQKSLHQNQINIFHFPSKQLHFSSITHNKIILHFFLWNNNSFQRDIKAFSLYSNENFSEFWAFSSNEQTSHNFSFFIHYKSLLSFPLISTLFLQFCFDWIFHTKTYRAEIAFEKKNSGDPKGRTTQTGANNSNKRQVRNVDFIVRLISLQTAYARSFCKKKTLFSTRVLCGPTMLVIVWVGERRKSGRECTNN